MTASPLLPLFLTIFVDVLGFTLVIPLLPYYALHFGATPLQVGLLNASYAAVQLLSGPLLGSLSDQLGRKRMLLASQLGLLVGFAILGGAQSLWMLFAGRLIAGATAGNLTIAQAYITDVTTPENRTRSFGLIGIAFGMGFLIGPPLAGVMAHRFGYPAPALAAAVLSMCSASLTFFFLPDLPPSLTPSTPRRSLSFGHFLRLPTARARLLQFFCYILSFTTLIGGIPLFLERRFHYNVEQTGYIFAFSGLIGAIIQGGLLGRLARALGEEKLATLGLLTMFSHAALGWINQLSFLLVVVAVGGFGTSVVRPALTTLITRSVPSEQQGAALGVSQSLGSLGQILGTISAGALIGRNLIPAFGILSAIFAAMGLALGFLATPVHLSDDRSPIHG
ncbi:MAG: MFS transporter [Myxococcales bacterium]|nr:MFS transporter [Polyangiaceae bacterium]MDW8247786.1 MFS transporter [Myxococcales bacterium]